MARMPSSSPPLPLRSRPTRATTPARPIRRPVRRLPPARSEGSKRIASIAAISGAVAITIAAVEEATVCSPAAIRGKGKTISITA